MREAIEGLLASLGVAARSVEPLAGDLSQRRYFRVRDASGAKLLAAHYPLEVRPVATRFSAARELLAAAGVRVPAILAWDESAGIMLLQSAPLMLVLFVLFPRVQGPIWGMPQDAYAGMTGLSCRGSTCGCGPVRAGRPIGCRIGLPER